MESKIDLIEILNSRLAMLQARNPSYSLRAFARSLKTPPPILSELLRGKRKLTIKNAKHLCDYLNLPPEHVSSILKQLGDSAKNVKNFSSFAQKAETLTHVQLSSDEFHSVADWYYFGILALAETQGFRSSIPWIAKRLRISKLEAQAAVKTLVRLGLLSVEDKKYLPRDVQFATTNDIPSSAIRKNHIQSMHLAIQSLEEDSIDQREFGSNIIAINTKRIPEARKIMREMRRRLAELLAEGDKTEVYRLNINLFPLSKELKK